MDAFLHAWARSAETTAGLFWSAFWAFALGYLVSSLIQVLVTEERMRQSMGDAGASSLALGTFFGFLSSSCSFAALSTTRALFARGAGLAASLAFLLASTNLVVELGIVIAVFLSWQFVVGEYVGGMLLILAVAPLARFAIPRRLVESARERARGAGSDGHDGSSVERRSWREVLSSRRGWERIANKYGMEWGMVWKDVAIGFAVAGAVAALVPPVFFRRLFIGSGDADAGFTEVLAQAATGPIAAFFTFIGSMGNVPLAGVLFASGVSFAGVMAFLFSDLVVLPVLRIHARYYGWPLALSIAGIFFIALVAVSIALHYGFGAAGILPAPVDRPSLADREYFGVDHTLFLNTAFAAMSAALVWVRWRAQDQPGGGHDHGSDREGGLGGLGFTALAALAWIGGGLVIGWL